MLSLALALSLLLLFYHLHNISFGPKYFSPTEIAKTETRAIKCARFRFLLN